MSTTHTTEAGNLWVALDVVYPIITGRPGGIKYREVGDSIRPLEV